MSSKMMVFTGNANPELARRVAERLYLSIGDAKVSKFSDGEITVELNENVRGKDVFVLQSTNNPTNDNLRNCCSSLTRSVARRLVELPRSFPISVMPVRTAAYALHAFLSQPKWLQR